MTAQLLHPRQLGGAPGLRLSSGASPSSLSSTVKLEGHMLGNRLSLKRRAITAVLLSLTLLGGGGVVPAAPGANAVLMLDPDDADNLQD